MSEHTKSILVVEDNASMRAVVKFALESEGFGVAVAVDGLAGLRMLREGNYDLIVTDQMMPRLNGVELVREARKLPNYSETPVILLTAKALELDVESLANEVGSVDIISKPFGLLELAYRIQELLGNPLKQANDLTVAAAADS